MSGEGIAQAIGREVPFCALSEHARNDGCAKRPPSGVIARVKLAFSTANERSVLVVEFARHFGSGLRGNELDLADEIFSPGFVYARAELALHAFKLLPPAFSVRGDFEAAILESDGPRVRSQGFSHDRGPGTLEPGERGLGPLEFSDNFSEKFSGAFHRNREIVT